MDSRVISLPSLLLLLVFIPRLISAFQVSNDGRAIIIDGQHRILISGSIHYPRSTPEMWPDLIKKAKEGGLDAIETYVFWNAHEARRRQYDFSDNLDLVKFIKTVQSEGLYAVLRIGPYVCAEWNYGGFPVWLHNLPGIEIRTANTVFMNEMQNFTTLIVDKMKEEKLFASQGGPIILAQIENEYGNIMNGYGAAGKSYIDWCAKLAVSLNIGVPWIMCQQSDAPQPMIDTCNGWYCDSFTPNNPNSPKMWTENWTGWFKSWGGKDPHRTAEDLAFSVAKFFQFGGTFQNYYMYHGGTNFDRSAGGPYITTSYDYDAPLDEYGNLNQPKYGHLTKLHNTLKSIERTLTHGNITNIDRGSSVMVTTYATSDQSSCFISNSDDKKDSIIDLNGQKFIVPAWSVSILPDCKTEAYNTAKVNTQTSVMVKKQNEADVEPMSLKWIWRPEVVNDTVNLGRGSYPLNRIIDQKIINDVSDYLWYMTSVDLEKNDPIWNADNLQLNINMTGHVLHVFVNGEYLGSKSASYGIFNYVFNKKVRLNRGKNQITLLSVTVGLQNYGVKFDLIQSGVSGPVQIIGTNGDTTIIKDLSSHKWVYKNGLTGLHNKFYAPNSRASFKYWTSDNLPVNRKLTWYKTTFKAPLGEDRIALDLQGMGKGVAWVNGHSLGRYWPSFITEDGCSLEPCDYRGRYDNNKCVSNCGKPSQQWYHVPRSFINGDKNELVLFEEFGGNPSNVNFQTISVGKACGNAYENNLMELSCYGSLISDIKFASFGNPRGNCGDSFVASDCDASNGTAISILHNECVGKEKCSIKASEDVFGPTKCSGEKRLVVEVVC